MDSVKELVNKLKKSNDVGTARELALRLAQSDNPKHHRELYRMAKGKHRRLIFRYGIDHIVLGVEALAETGTKKALDFLERVLDCDVYTYDGNAAQEEYLRNLTCEERQHTEAHPYFGGVINTYKFRNAPRKLKSLLEDNNYLGQEELINRLRSAIYKAREVYMLKQRELQTQELNV